MLVLPVPGGPHRIIDDNFPAATDRPVGPGQMFLADNLVEALRPKLIGQGRSGGWRLRRTLSLLISEQVGHRRRS